LRGFHLSATVLLLFLLISGCRNKEVEVAPEAEPATPVAPAAKQIEKGLTIHGHTRIDEYYWLRERENPEVIAYLTAENEYKDAVMKHTEAFQERLFTEMVGRIPRVDASVPYKEQGYWYYIRYEEGKEYPVYCRKKETLDSPEEVMLNVNEMAEGFDFYRVTGFAVSPNNNILAYGVDTVSRRKYTIHFKDLRTGMLLEDEIPVTTGRAVWANDNMTVFYTLKDETLRPYKIASHQLGKDNSSDREIFHEADPTFNTYVFKSKSRRYIFINSESTLSSEFRFLDADLPDGEFEMLHAREKNLECKIEHFKDEFFIVTNYMAKNFRLMKTPVSDTSKENWIEVIPHREDVFLQGIEIFDRFIVVSERRNGLTELRVISWEDWSEHDIDFGEETYAAYIGKNPEFDTDVLRFNYSSLTTPYSTFDYHMVTRAKTLLKREKVLGDFDPSDYQAERLHAVARDGVKIPISLVYRKGISRDRSNPLLLYGYGSYGASMNASFRSYRLSLLDRGFIYAIAHIRGGQEMGRYWYEDGKLLKKKNTFTDFIDCAEYLCLENYTSPEKLFAMGESAGGLLMGAVINMRPDLFKGVVAAVPWVDVVTTMLDESIPLTTAEYDEWGNPNKREYYDYMLSYSPYDNVRAMDYPAMLVTTGLHDSQVQYWEPAKWVARIRAMKTDDNILLLHTNMGAGHGGVSGRFRRYRETALEYAFILDQIGINE